MKREVILKKLERLEETVEKSNVQIEILTQKYAETWKPLILEKGLLKNLSWTVLLEHSSIWISTHQFPKKWVVFIKKNPFFHRFQIIPGVYFNETSDFSVSIHAENLRCLQAFVKHLGKKAVFNINDAQKRCKRIKKGVKRDEEVLSYLEGQSS